MEEIKELLVKKFEDIQKRLLLVLDQLTDDEINWRPNESSNSIANLCIHIDGNIGERIGKGINKREFIRNRDEEFDEFVKSKNDLIAIIKKSFRELIETTSNMTEETMMSTQWVRNKERSNLDMLIQCATHFSEHMGQVLYIGKMIKDTDYISTSIPKRKQ